MKKTDLKTMIVAELKALAKKMKIKLPADARKADIVDALAAASKKAATPAAKKNVTALTRAAAQKRAAVSRKKPVVKKGVRTDRLLGKKETPERTSVQEQGVPPAKPSVSMPPFGREWKTPPRAEEPMMAQDRVADAKYYTGPGREQAGASASLPVGYGVDMIALMARDPSIAYAYWEVAPSRLERERTWFGWNGKLTIRIYDVTGIEFDGRNAAGYVDQEVEELVGSWYFDLGRPAHSFVADLGLLTPDNRFLTLVRSNRVIMPRDGVSDVVDDEWLLADEAFWQLYGLPGGLSSAQLQEMVRIRRMQQQVSSPGPASSDRMKGK